MDRETAKVVAVAAFRSSAEINNLIPMLKSVCTEPEYSEWRDSIAMASLQISTNILMKVFAEHPDLEAEIGAHYERFGRPA